jgi:signal transduction histidine kinase
MAPARLRPLLEKILLIPAEQDATLLQWRISILRTVMLTTLLLGLMTLIPHSFFPLPDRSLILLADVVALILICFVTFYARFGFKTRAWIFLGLIYLFWVWLSFQVQGLSVIFLIGVPLLAAMLLGLAAGILALLFCMLSLFGLGMVFFPDFQLDPAPDLSPAQTWLLMLLNYSFVAGLLTIAVGVLIGRLEVALELSHNALRSLNQQGKALHRQNQNLRQEIELRELAEAEAERLALAVAQARELIVISDTHGAITYTNQACREVFGATLPITHIQGIGGTDAQQHTLGERMAACEVWRGNVELQDQRGKLRTLEAIVTPLRNRENTVSDYVAVMRDVTQEHQLEQRLRQSEKLQAVGTLASGVAHDFNNVLAIIMALTEELKLENQSLSEKLNQIVLSCERGRDIVRQLLTFSRQSLTGRGEIDLATVVREMRPLLKAQVPPRTRFDVEVTGEARILSNASEIQQVLMNLISNAVHAVKDCNDGQIRLDVYPVAPADPLLEELRELDPQRSYVCLAVSDNGKGITEQNMTRLFEPFFTTREPGQGTGLGLPSYHGMVSSLGGGIAVASTVGVGTRFSVVLPTTFTSLAPEDVQEMRDDTSNANTAAVVKTDAGHHVLLVDDEPLILRTGAAMLTASGFQVRSANGAAEARELLDSSVSILITDYSMPGENGLSLIKHTRSRFPALAVILTTGLGTLDEEDLSAMDRLVLLPKPYKRQELLNAIAQLL